MNTTSLALPADYADWLSSLKQRIQGARQRALLSANAQQIRLYHDIGRDILERQNQQGWGAKVIERLANDLRAAFPEMRGFSATNLKYMRFFAHECPNLQIGQQSADQLPWFHIVTLITKLADPVLRGQILKDPYHFDFLGLGDEAHERDIESALIRHVTRFLLELGAGFAFVGRQFRLEVAGDEFFIDLLFYHTRLKCYVVVELKAHAFKPEHVGQLSFYLSAVDAQVKAVDDKPTIGLLLCRTQNRLVAEYALSGVDKPIGVAEYQLVRALPVPLDTSLPSVEDIEAELSRDLGVDDDAEHGASGGEA
jgi:predicted nuclease of restriction endonuclease-like (RecB) superfamily